MCLLCVWVVIYIFFSFFFIVVLGFTKLNVYIAYFPVFNHSFFIFCEYPIKKTNKNCKRNNNKDKHKLELSTSFLFSFFYMYSHTCSSCDLYKATTHPRQPELSLPKQTEQFIKLYKFILDDLLLFSLQATKVFLEHS